MKSINRICAVMLVWSLIYSLSVHAQANREYRRLLQLQQQALQHPAGKTYVCNITGRSDCNKTRITYLGIARTKHGKQYKICTVIFVFSAASTCHGSSCIKIFDRRNKYVGAYYVDDLPDRLAKNQLIYANPVSGCELTKGMKINLSNGLPRRFFLPCSKAGGDLVNFSSGD